MPGGGLMPGGTSAPKEIDDNVRDICTKVKPEVETKLNKPLGEFTPKSYKSQVVAGANYFVKVHVGNGEHLHLRIFRSLQGDISLHSLQEGKTEEDDIAYF